MTCAQLRTKTRTSISRNICCVKSGFQILYAVEQFSSLFSKDILKQGAHIHQTYDPPSPRVSWENCRAVPSQQLPHVLCGVCRGTKGRLMPNIKDKMLLGGVILLEYNKEKASSRGLFVIHPMVFLLL